MLIDSHCHVDRQEYGADLDGVIERSKAAGVVHSVVIGLWRGPGDFGGARDLARAHAELFSPTIGIHPHDVAQAPPEDFAILESLAGEADVMGVGETGLDYHYDHSPRPRQREAFRRHIQLARRVGKPVVVHVREAHADCAAILGEEPAGPGVIHCFTGNWDEARRYLDLGLFLSISGVVTFQNATQLREAVPKIPLDRLLVETDSPFLAPVPHRGRRNEPAYVREVAAKVALLRGEPFEAIARATADNARRLFGLSFTRAA